MDKLHEMLLHRIDIDAESIIRLISCLETHKEQENAVRILAGIMPEISEEDMVKVAKCENKNYKYDGKVCTAYKINYLENKVRFEFKKLRTVRFNVSFKEGSEEYNELKSKVSKMSYEEANNFTGAWSGNNYYWLETNTEEKDREYVTIEEWNSWSNFDGVEDVF